MSLPEFKTFQKIPRLFRDVIITEKLDGTNAQIYIPDNPDEPLVAGSRNRWIYPGKYTDNYDFAAFVEQNSEMLRRLGPGLHYGEWWGCGIARKYGLTGRRWSLFNVHKELPEGLPVNVGHVPILYEGMFDMDILLHYQNILKDYGSHAAPGFMNPEGIVLFHRASGQLYKYTFGGDGHKKAKEA